MAEQTIGRAAVAGEMMSYGSIEEVSRMEDLGYGLAERKARG